MDLIVFNASDVRNTFRLNSRSCPRECIRVKLQADVTSARGDISPLIDFLKTAFPQNTYG